MIVMKFGGSSVKDAERFKNVVSIVKARLDKKPIVVLSAVKGVTDNLIKALDESLEENFNAYDEIVAKHKEIIHDLGIEENVINEELKELKEALEVNSKIKEKNAKILDYISFFGERMSTKLLAAYLTKVEINSKAYVSGDIGLLTDSNFGDATFQESSYEVMNNNLSNLDNVAIVTGFGGKDDKGEYATFNRGGSDYVAALVGAAVNAEEIQIWTDVNGVMTTDPRIVETAKTIPELSFSEAAELAFFGAKVLHPKTIKPAIAKNIPVKVLNTYEPDHAGTTILPKIDCGVNEIAKAITTKKNVTIINLCSSRMLNAYGYLAKVFEIFQKYQKSVDMVTTSEVNLSITIDNDDNLDQIVGELKEFGNVVVEKEKAIVSIVGDCMKKTLGIGSKIFSILAGEGVKVEMISQGASEINISFVIENEKAETAVKALHKGLF